MLDNIIEGLGLSLNCLQRRLYAQLRCLLVPLYLGADRARDEERLSLIVRNRYELVAPLLWWHKLLLPTWRQHLRHVHRALHTNCLHFRSLDAGQIFNVKRCLVELFAAWILFYAYGTLHLRKCLLPWSVTRRNLHRINRIGEVPVRVLGGALLNPMRGRLVEELG